MSCGQRKSCDILARVEYYMFFWFVRWCSVHDLISLTVLTRNKDQKKEQLVSATQLQSYRLNKIPDCLSVPAVNLFHLNFCITEYSHVYKLTQQHTLKFVKKFNFQFHDVWLMMYSWSTVRLLPTSMIILRDGIVGKSEKGNYKQPDNLSSLPS